MSDRSHRLLTIVIPTRNRARALEATLSSLRLACADPRVKICVVDNCSDDDTFESLSVWRENGVEVTRNGFDLGIEGNIVKSIFLASSGYVWLLSDHMIVRWEAVQELLLQIESGQKFDVGCMGIEDYGVLEVSPGRVINTARWNVMEAAYTLFNVSNISSVVFRADYAHRQSTAIYRLCGCSYPHLGLYRDLRVGVDFFYIKNASRFNSEPLARAASRKSYNVIVARFHDFLGAISDIGPDGGRGMVYAATLHPSYFSAIYGFLVSWIEDNDEESCASTRRDILRAVTVNPLRIKLLFCAGIVARYLASMRIPYVGLFLLRAVRRLLA